MLPIEKPLRHTSFYGVEPTDMLTGEWLRQWSARGIRARSSSTQYPFLRAIESLILYFGDIPLQRLNPPVIQERVDRMSADGKTPSTIHEHFCIFQTALRAACRRKYLGFNPCPAVKLPSCRRRMRNGISHEEFQKLLEVCRGTRMENFVPVKAYAALRSGEIYGLSWRQVDFSHGTLLIDQQLLHITDPDSGKRKNVLVKRTKTRVYRVIRPSAECFRLLQKEREKQERYRAGNPQWNNPMDLVFTDKNGASIIGPSMNVLLKKLCKKAQVAELTLHDLRHYGAVLQYERSGCDLWSVKSYLGHKQLRITISYLYVTIQQMRMDAAKIDRFYSDLLRNA